MSGTLPCRADTQCRPRFGDIWRCRRHVADMSPTCGAKIIIPLKKITKKCGTISVNLLWLWWSYALDPAYCRVAHGVRVTAMCWVVGIRPPQAMVGPTPLRRHGDTTKTKIISARGPHGLYVGIVQEDVTHKNTRNTPRN